MYPKLGLGKSVKVGDVPTENFEVLNNPLVTIMGIEIPRALRGKSLEGEEEGEEGAEGSEEAAEAPAEG